MTESASRGADRWPITAKNTAVIVVDMQNIWGASARRASPADVGRFGGRVKLVGGFKGTAEIRLAMQSDEVNSVITGWETLGASNYKDFESGE